PFGDIDGRINVVFHILICSDERNAFADRPKERFGSNAELFLRTEPLQPQIDGLRRAESFKGEHGLEVSTDGAQLYRSGRTHRNVILDICRTRYRIDARRMSEHFVLG